MRQHQGGHGVVAATITDPTKIEGIDAALLKRWFGKVKAEDGQTIQYDPADPVAKLWGTAGATSGEFPAITEVQVFTDSPQQTRRYTRFGDGLTVFQTTGAKPTLLQGNGAASPREWMPVWPSAGLARQRPRMVRSSASINRTRSARSGSGMDPPPGTTPPWPRSRSSRTVRPRRAGISGSPAASPSFSRPARSHGCSTMEARHSRPELDAVWRAARSARDPGERPHTPLPAG